MSPSPSSQRRCARLFAALGDETRLLLIARLSTQRPHSISQLTEGMPVTRQAITKHLKVMQGAGLVRCQKSGRESLFQMDPKPLQEVRSYLDEVSSRYDDALTRLKLFVEEG